MTQLRELLADLEAELASIVANQAKWLAEQIRNQTPANLTKTRAGIYHRSNGTQAEVGIRFAKKYGGETPTKERLQRQWARLKPEVASRIISDIESFLKG